MMRILLTGAGGQLGWELQRSLATLGAVTTVDLPAYNLAQPDTILELARQLRPQVIVNPAAYTDVDGAELDMVDVLLEVVPDVLPEFVPDVLPVVSRVPFDVMPSVLPIVPVHSPLVEMVEI